MTLIRFAREANFGSALFVGTIWDAIMTIAANGTFTVLNSYPEAVASAGHLIPSNFPFYAGHGVAGYSGKHQSYMNTVWDYLIYNNYLYLTDGLNRGIKTDGTDLGEWGYQKFTNAASMLLIEEQNAAGNLADGTYYYKLTLYDSVNVLEGNICTVAVSHVANAAGEKLWIYGDMTKWTLDDNYDFKNEFANKIRVYRTPKIGGGAEDDYYFVAELNNICAYTGTIAIDAAGNVTGTTTNFVNDGVEAGYVLYIADGGGGWDIYQISVVTAGGIDLDVLDPDGTAYSGGVYAAGKAYRILPGVIDNLDTLTGAIYFGNDTSLAANVRDHSAPERCKYCAMFNERAFLAGDPNNPNYVYYSEIGKPDYFPVDNYIDIDPDDGDAITALIKFQGRLLIFKRNSVAVLNTLGEPIAWSVTPKYLSEGTIDRRLVMDCGGVLIFVNPGGVFLWDGGSLRRISHEERSSNIIKQWDEDVVLSELVHARVVFHEFRNEFWMSVCMDDQRNLYDSGLAGLGTITEYASPPTLTAGLDGGGVPQNNGTFVYRLDTGQWFWNPHIHASCWCRWHGESDMNELFRGDVGAKVYQEDTVEAVDDASCAHEQATDGGNTTLTDGDADWETDEWIGATVYVHHADNTIEKCTIGSNTGTVLTGEAGTFEGAANNQWTTNPALYDHYLIVKESSSGVINVKWRTPMLVFDSLREVKWFLEMLVRIYGTSLFTISWSLDGGEGIGGSFQFNPTQGTTFLGVHDLSDESGWANNTGVANELEDDGSGTANWTLNEWAGYTVWLLHLADNSIEERTINSNTAHADNTLTVSANWDTNPAEGDLYWIGDSNTMILTALGTVMKEFNFPENECKMVELQLTGSSAQKIEVSMVVLGYKIHRGNRWE